MSNGVTFAPSRIIYSKVDDGTGYKSYATDSVKLSAGATFIRAKVQLPNARQRLAVFINGINAESSFIITQRGRTVTIENLSDFSAFARDFTLSFDIKK